jgi:hypothetical protein
MEFGLRQMVCGSHPGEAQELGGAASCAAQSEMPQKDSENEKDEKE